MFKLRPLVAAIAAATVLVAPAAFAQGKGPSGTVKVAFIDPLSGLMAPVGQNQLKSWQYIADMANTKKWAGDVKFEMVPFDGKLSPQESLTALKQVIDQGIRYVVQGNGSSVAAALSDAIAKHNERNPGKEIVYLNYAAVEPSLTNDKCSFWHFRIDLHSDMKMEALTAYLAKDQKVKKVYLINQDYSFGHAVETTAEEYLKRKRPDIQIVGKDRHPLAQVRDFSPYIAKMKAAGADTVITGNWGNDISLLIKAAKDAGFTGNFYTYYAMTTGTPTAMGASGAERVKTVGQWNVNDGKPLSGQVAEGYLKKFNDDYYTDQTYIGIHLLSEAFKRTGSTDPVKVAFALEGMKLDTINGEVEMRATDHQLQQPVYIATWAKADGKKVKYEQEKTGYGWRLEQEIPAYVASQPTSCQMKRPAKP